MDFEAADSHREALHSLIRSQAQRLGNITGPHGVSIRKALAGADNAMWSAEAEADRDHPAHVHSDMENAADWLSHALTLAKRVKTLGPEFHAAGESALEQARSHVDGYRGHSEDNPRWHQSFVS